MSENVSQHLEHWVIREIDPGPNKAPQHVFCTQIIWYSRKLILVQPMPASNNIYLDFVVRQTTLVVLNNVPSLKSNMTESEKYLVTDTNSFNQCWISILYISYIPAVQIGWPDDDTIDSFYESKSQQTVTITEKCEHFKIGIVFVHFHTWMGNVLDISHIC